jgi:hypothetical protein
MSRMNFGVSRLKGFLDEDYIPEGSHYFTWEEGTFREVCKGLFFW